MGKSSGQNQGRQRAILAIITASVAASTFAISSCREQATSQVHSEAGERRILTISIVDKSAQFSGSSRLTQPFLARWARPSHHIYVAPSPVAEARLAQAIEVPAGQELYLVEGHPLPQEALPGEVFREADVAAVLIGKDQDAHDVLGHDSFYAEQVGTSLISAKDAASPFVAEDDAEAPLTLPLSPERTLPRSDAAWLEQKVRELSGDKPVTLNGRVLKLNNRQSATGRADARLWLRKQFEELGFTVSEPSYRSGRNAGYNLVASRPADVPNSDGFVIISGHYDSVGNAGADDDAAGMVSVLQVARALADSPLRRELRVLAFDQEELGLLGSAAYARQLRDSRQISRLQAVFQVEMPTYDQNKDGHYHVVDCNENRSAELSAVVEAAGRQVGLHRVDACTNRSDHASFWRYDRPAIVLSQNFFGGDSNPCYHRSCDKVNASLDFGYMAKLTDALTHGVAATVLAQP